MYLWGFCLDLVSPFLLATLLLLWNYLILSVVFVSVIWKRRSRSDHHKGNWGLILGQVSLSVKTSFEELSMCLILTNRFLKASTLSSMVLPQAYYILTYYTILILFFRFRLLKSSLLVCSSALDMSLSLFHKFIFVCGVFFVLTFFFFFWLFRLLTVAFVVTQTQYLGLLSSSSLMKVSFSLIFFFKVCVNVGLMGLTIWGIVVGARAALNLSGTILGFYHVKVMPSKTAIAPVNPTFLPRVRHFFWYCVSSHSECKVMCFLWLSTCPVFGY